MLVYRFRITCEELDGFLREIEILPNQTFLDFHYILTESSELIHCNRASFFITDKKYKKDKEISLKAEKRQVRKYDEELDQVVTELVSLPLMKASKLKNFIEDPHQKMIYEFEGRDHFSFHIELFKIFPCEENESFPRCVRRIAELPKKAEQPVPEIVETPVIPRVVMPKIPLPGLVDLAKFDDLVEDEQEMAAIEKELGGLLPEDIAADHEEAGHEGEHQPEYSYPDHEAEDEDHEGNLDHIEDYDDIESLDKRLSGYDHDPDEF